MYVHPHPLKHVSDRDGRWVGLKEDDYEAMKREIDKLRSILAYEARVLEAHYEGLKTFSKSRLPVAKEQVQRMRDYVARKADGYIERPVQVAAELKRLEKSRA